jgi:hypothetical protein
MFRTLKPSTATTPGSARTDGASWSCPTSTASTARAPRSRSTCVNPPVDAPMSSASRPDVDAEPVERGDELVRPRLT